MRADQYFSESVENAKKSTIKKSLLHESGMRKATVELLRRNSNLVTGTEGNLIVNRDVIKRAVLSGKIWDIRGFAKKRVMEVCEWLEKTEINNE